MGNKEDIELNLNGEEIHFKNASNGIKYVYLVLKRDIETLRKIGVALLLINLMLAFEKLPQILNLVAVALANR